MKNEKEVFRKGKAYFIRSLTFHMVGEVVDVVDGFILMKNASWIADSGRFMNALRDGTLDEVEPCGDAIVNCQNICDAFPWMHKLPREQK